MSNNNEFKWDDETVLEFIEFTLKTSPLLQGRRADIQQFKESKQPKPKDWEILSYWSSTIPCYVIEQDHQNWYADRNSKNPIHSVKRLSDNEVFTIGDKVTFENNKKHPNPDIIEEIKLGDNQFGPNSPLAPYFSVERQSFGCYIDKIYHFKEFLFTSEDGINIFDGDDVCLLSIENWIVSFPVKASEKPFKGDKYFSCPTAAFQYKFDNQPLLSLKEIRSVGNVSGNNPYYTKLAGLAESKLK